MAVYFPVRTCMKTMISFTGVSYRNMSNNICDVSFGGSSRMRCFDIRVGQTNCNSPLTSSANSCTTVRLKASHWSCLGSINAKQINSNHSLKLNCIRDTRFSGNTCLDISLRSHNMNVRLLMPNKGNMAKTKYNIRPGSWHQCYGPVSLLIGFSICCSSSEPSYAEAPDDKNSKEDNSSSSPGRFSHGKKVYSDYSVIGIPGDGRCLFRSVAHGACLRSGKAIPDENLQRKLADELRNKVADEFIKRREETEWFIEGDFDTYVRQIRKCHVWGGEPELLMASHVLQMPITVYMDDQESGGLISIAEYGQEYDGLSLLALKAAITTDPKSVLSSWSDLDSTPCLWSGITCDHNKKVASISLSNKGLSGYIPSELGALSSLTVMNLSFNNFSKPIPVHLFNAISLLSLDLSNNAFYGNLPTQINELKNLSYLDISMNQLNGTLPDGLSSLDHLVGTLNLSYNGFSGEIPTSYGGFPVMVSLDLRNNNLTGKIPQVGSLLNQGPTAFSGNPYLCGFPLETSCRDDPVAALNSEVLDRPRNPSDLSNVVVEKEKLSNGSMTVSLVSGVSVVVGIIVVSMWVIKKKWKFNDDRMGKDILEKEVGVKGGVVVEGGENEDDQNGKFVVVDEGFVFELEDLLRASAYVVGKSRSGIVYKVVVGVGGGKRSGGGESAMVAVRRLSEGDTTWRFKEFVAEIEAIGKVSHPNIVRLKACYYASDEKLLVSEFIRNGSLYNALHGGHGSSLPPLAWSSRLQIIQGTARGLAHIHECSPRKYVHGNLRSSKILLDDDLQPFISGFGLTRLVPGTSKPLNASSKKPSSDFVLVSPKASMSNMYMAPEARIIGSKLTQKCDVYSYGIVLLEILTGRMPDGDSDNDGKGLEGVIRKAFREERPLSEIIDPALLHEVQAKKQVVAAFHIALSCTELDPELRPRMKSVSESLDRINLS